MFEKSDKVKSRDNYVSQKMQALQNNLLGNYNKQGKYVIDEHIVNELVSMQKIYNDATKGELYASAQSKNGRTLKFQIRMNTYPLKDMSVAKLYLLEDIPCWGGRTQKTIKTKVGKFTDDIADDFFEKAIDYFNVIIDEDDKGEEVKGEQIKSSNIDIKQELNNAITEYSVQQFDDIYKRMFNEKFLYLRRLTNSPFAREVLGEFMEEIKDGSAYYYKDFSKKIPNYTAMYELLADKISENETERMFQNDNGLFGLIKLEHQIAERENQNFDYTMEKGFSHFQTGSNIIDWLGEKFGNHLEKLNGDAGIFNNIFERVGNAFENSVDSIKDGFSRFGDSVSEFANSAYKKVKDFFNFDGEKKQVIKEANGLYIDTIVEKFMKIDDGIEYSQNVIDKANNLYVNKESNLVNNFKNFETNNVKNYYGNEIIKSEMFNQSNINQAMETKQIDLYNQQTNMVLNQRINSMQGAELTKNLK